MELVYNRMNVRQAKLPVVIEEVYDFPVLTMHPKPVNVDKGSRFKFSFNKAAMELLNTPLSVMPAFIKLDENGKEVALPTPLLVGLTENNGNKLVNNSFWNKEMFTNFVEFFKTIDVNEETEFELVLNTEITGLLAVSVFLLETTSVVEEPVIPTLIVERAEVPNPPEEIITPEPSTRPNADLIASDTF